MHITTCPRCQGRIKTVRVVPGFSYGVDRECTSCTWVASRWEGLKRERIQCLDCRSELSQEDSTHYRCTSCSAQYLLSLEQVIRVSVPTTIHAETRNL